MGPGSKWLLVLFLWLSLVISHTTFLTSHLAVRTCDFLVLTLAMNTTARQLPVSTYRVTCYPRAGVSHVTLGGQV